ncbi:MAG TPA: hypothetical protein VGN11_01805 [Candidatus Baltobacteraceae bacterium]|jgi:hypothetical protein|nr:hypothetical protein [Candidatus Baltobacteraceae bacterium]
MHDRFFELPEPAQQLVRTIEATIDEAGPLLRSAGAPAELAFNLQETRTAYLPQTIDAYVAVPRSQRDAKDASGRSALDLLLEQLSILDRATKSDLELLAKGKRSELAANARFLAERFDDRSTEISEISEAPVDVASAVPGLQHWLPEDAASPQDTVAHVAFKFQKAFPAITELRYSGMWGMGPIEAVLLTLQQGGGTAFRYALSAKGGILEPSVAKLVHGTTIQTVRCSVEDWLQSLYDDIVEQARHRSEMRAALTRLLQ